MTVAARYARKSTQAKSRRATSPETQLAECDDYAAGQGWEVHPAEFIDPETSAFRRRNGRNGDGEVKHRPGFEALALAVEAGGIDVVLCWDVNRITRDTEVAIAFAKLCRRHGVAIEDVRGNRYDLSTNRGYSEFVGAANAAEIDSARKSEMVSRELAVAAKEGAPHGGPAMFGYCRIPRSADSEPALAVNEEQARYIRDGAAAILRGESLRSVTKTWNAIWPSATMREVKRTLTAPRVAGLRSHTTYGVDGQPTTALHLATWQPILERRTWDDVVEILSNPGRDNRRGRPASYLLSGIAKCSCGAALISKARGGGKYGYRCPENHVGRDKTKLETFVEAVVFESIDGGALARLTASLTKADPKAAELVEERKRLTTKRERLVDLAADGLITKGDLGARLAEVKADVARLDARRSLSADRRLVESIPEGEAFPRWWASSTLASRRWLVAHLLQITVSPARRGVHELQGVDVVPLV